MASQFLMPVRQGRPLQRLPMDPLLIVQRDMDRLFGNLVRSFVGSEDRPGELLLAPRIDVSETETGLRIDAELPGASEQEIEVSLDGNELVIAGEIRREQREEERGYRIAERQVGRFRRALQLPFEPDPEQIDAQFRDGLLTLTIARPVQAEGPKRIALNAGETGAKPAEQPAEATEAADTRREPAEA